MRVSIPMRSRLVSPVSLALAVPLLVALGGCDLGGASRQAAGSGTPLVTAPAVTTPSPVTVDGVTYQRYTDPTFGFSLEIPSVLTENGSQANPSSGGGISAWNAAYPTAQDALELYITTATKGIDPKICQMGEPITIGSGLKGYQQDIFSEPTPVPMPNSGAPPNSQVSASVVENGVWVSINLTGMPPADTFMQRYGSIWHEMLASFTPGTSANPGATNNPCAG